MLRRAPILYWKMPYRASFFLRGTDARLFGGFGEPLLPSAIPHIDL